MKNIPIFDNILYKNILKEYNTLITNKLHTYSNKIKKPRPLLAEALLTDGKYYFYLAKVLLPYHCHKLNVTPAPTYQPDG